MAFIRRIISLNQHFFQCRMYGSAGSGQKLKIGVQGAGFGGGQTKLGIEAGPSIIRKSGFTELLTQEVGHDIKDYGDLTFEGFTTEAPTIIEGCVPLKNVAKVASANQQIYTSTLQILEESRIPLTLGGDHSISIGTLNAVSEAYGKEGHDVGVLWVDAHTDLNTPFTTNSGNLHGLPLAFSVKELEDKMKCVENHFHWVTPRVPARNIAYIGLREFGGMFNPRAQRDTVKRLGIKAFTMSDVDEVGISKVTEMALDHIANGSSGRRPIYLSFDIDSLDDLEVGRFTGTSVAGGLTLREGITLLENVYQSSCEYAAVDFVEVNPLLGDPLAQERAAMICKHLLGAMFGYRRGGL